MTDEGLYSRMRVSGENQCVFDYFGTAECMRARIGAPGLTAARGSQGVLPDHIAPEGSITSARLGERGIPDKFCCQSDGEYLLLPEVPGEWYSVIKDAARRSNMPTVYL